MKVSGSKLTIPAIKLPDGTISQASTVDLEALQGQTVRIYTDASGMVQINPASDCYWQMCEVILPPRIAAMDQGMPQAGGKAANPVKPAPLDLSMINISTFPLPK